MHERTQINLFSILLNQTEMELYLPFWFQSTKFRKDFSVCALALMLEFSLKIEILTRIACNNLIKMNVGMCQFTLIALISSNMRSLVRNSVGHYLGGVHTEKSFPNLIKSIVLRGLREELIEPPLPLKHIR